MMSKKKQARRARIRSVDQRTGKTFWSDDTRPKSQMRRQPKRDRVSTVEGKLIPLAHVRLTKDEERDIRAYLKRTHELMTMGKLVPKLPRVVKPGLDMRVLQAVSVTRTTDPRGFNMKFDDWSVLEWGGATAGECGEANNVAKKLLRLRKKLRGNFKKGDQSEVRLKKKLGKEIADTILYCVDWAASEGLDVSDLVTEVFNAKNHDIGYDFDL